MVGHFRQRPIPSTEAARPENIISGISINDAAFGSRFVGADKLRQAHSSFPEHNRSAKKICVALGACCSLTVWLLFLRLVATTFLLMRTHFVSGWWYVYLFSFFFRKSMSGHLAQLTTMKQLAFELVNVFTIACRRSAQRLTKQPSGLTVGCFMK